MLLRQCLQCEGLIKQGKADRKFCSEGCKNEHHNNQKAEARNGIIRIEKALKNNLQILKKVLGAKQKEIVTRETLLKMGFEFKYCTHHHFTACQNNEYIFCYQYGYRKIDETKLKVVKSFK